MQKILSFAIAMIALSACTKQAQTNHLIIAEQGVFASGGSVTEPIAEWLEQHNL